MTEKALYPGYDPAKKYDHVNAVWHSLFAAGCSSNIRNAESYLTIYALIANAENHPTHKVLARDPETKSHPVAISKALRKLRIVLGLIFSDDPSVIVWPFGKPTSQCDHDLVVYCKPGNSTRWRYEGVKFLQIGQKPVRPPRAQHAFSDIRTLRWGQRHADHSLGPFAFGVLPLILAIANQSTPHWKPFSFLRLPAELRNKVYGEYLSHEHWSFAISLSCNSITYFHVPELCKVSHQLLQEVLPIYLERKPLLLHETLFARFQPLGAQPLLRPLLRFKKINIKLGEYLLKLRSSDTGSAFSVEYEHHSSLPHRLGRILLRPNQFSALVRILGEDASAPGLGLEELAAVVEYIFHEKERKLQIQK